MTAPAVVSASRTRRHPLRAIVALSRPDQWVKNAFVFGGLVFGDGLRDPFRVRAALWTFVAFCLVSSAAYALNDIADREVDRAHPRKRRRPLAAGDLSIGAASAVHLLLLAGGLAVGFVRVPDALPHLVAYAVLNLAYSFLLRRAALLDVMAIALGFVLRVQAGCAAMPIEPSAWILLCTFVLALFLGFGKRRVELDERLAAGPRHDDGRARYDAGALDHMMSIASAVTIVCYAMFTMWPSTVTVHGTSRLIYTVPFVIYGVFRYQWMITHGSATGDAGELVWRDRPLLAAIFLWGAACVVLLYGDGA
jgi:4-hydroxybenzoate polyprenyltransferase